MNEAVATVVIDLGTSPAGVLIAGQGVPSFVAFFWAVSRSRWSRYRRACWLTESARHDPYWGDTRRYHGATYPCGHDGGATTMRVKRER